MLAKINSYSLHKLLVLILEIFKSILKLANVSEFLVLSRVTDYILKELVELLVSL